jgi:hypothetical protein
MGTINKKEIYEVLDLVVTSVEAGNINKKIKDEDIYVAFSGVVDGIDKPVKLILKGKQAKAIYNAFLIDGNTLCEEVTECDIKFEKIVTVDFIALLKEDRPKELVLYNPASIVFRYVYSWEDEGE